MLVRTIELLSLSTFAVGSIIAQTATSPPSWVFQGGALALVAFMVAQNYRQMKETNKVLQHKNRLIERQSIRLLEAEENFAKALDRLAGLLEKSARKEGK